MTVDTVFVLLPEFFSALQLRYVITEMSPDMTALTRVGKGHGDKPVWRWF